MIIGYLPHPTKAPNLGSRVHGWGRKQGPGLLSNQGEKKYKLLFHKGSFKKKVLKHGTPKPRDSTVEI